MPSFRYGAVLLPFTLLIATTQAGTFGVYDARTQALGGTAVALAGPDQGHFYNPALTAMHSGDEDDTQDGRYSFTVLTDGISDGAQTAVDAITDDLEGQLSTAINNLNADSDVNTARAAITAARELDRSMRELEQQDINANVYVGFSITEPGDKEGGAFFLSSRLLAAGNSNIEQADLDLLEDYLEALSFIESFGTEGRQHPELLDGNGQFINPSDDIQSSADATALLITEMGVSGAKQFELWGQDLAFGVAPKIVQLRSYDERWGIKAGEFNNASDEETRLFANLDLGILWSFRDRYRVGLSVKDVLNQEWQTELGQTFNVSAKSRLGLAYWGKYVRFGVDADLNKSNYINSDLPVQEVSVGLEWQLFSSLALRAGYHQDLEETLGASTSGGIALKLRGMAMELSVVSGDEEVGAALQFSYYH